MGKLTSVFRMKDGEIAIPDHDYPPDARETEFALTSNVNAFRTLFCASVGPLSPRAAVACYGAPPSGGNLMRGMGVKVRRGFFDTPNRVTTGEAFPSAIGPADHLGSALARCGTKRARPSCVWSAGSIIAVSGILSPQHVRAAGAATFAICPMTGGMGAAFRTASVLLAIDIVTFIVASMSFPTFVQIDFLFLRLESPTGGHCELPAIVRMRCLHVVLVQT
jgi:hypothetical protein